MLIFLLHVKIIDERQKASKIIYKKRKTYFTRQVKTRTLSKIIKRNSMCERMLVDSTWLVDWPIDCSSSVI